MYFSYSPHHTGMKLRLQLFILFLVAWNFASAQKPPVVKVYAFIQHVLPGTKKNVIVQENGNTIEPAAQKKVNYLFYVEQKKSEPIKIAGIWMNGKKYLARADNVSTNPIEIVQEGSSNKITLSPAEGNEILQIQPGAETTKGTVLPKGLKKDGSAIRISCYLCMEWKNMVFAGKEN